MRKAGYERMKKINRIYFEDSENIINLNEIPNKSSLKTIKEDIKICLNELGKVGLNKVFFKDLTREEIGVSVARVIIPNAELYALDPSRIGERAVQYDLAHKK